MISLKGCYRGLWITRVRSNVVNDRSEVFKLIASIVYCVQGGETNLAGLDRIRSRSLLVIGTALGNTL